MPTRSTGPMPFVPLVSVDAERQVVAVAEHLRKDLTEPERDEGEVVALQAQRRRTDDHTGKSGHDTGNDDDEPEREVDAGNLGAGGVEEVEVDGSGVLRQVDREVRHEPRADVGADQEEGDVSEVEQTGEPDDDVQTEREQRVHGTEHDREQRQVAVGLLGEPQVRQHERKRHARTTDRRLRKRRCDG